MVDKTPSDEAWSRISPPMAKADLDGSSHLELAWILTRIATNASLAAPTATTGTGATKDRPTGTGPAPRPAEGSDNRGVWTPRTTNLVVQKGSPEE